VGGEWFGGTGAGGEFFSARVRGNERREGGVKGEKSARNFLDETKARFGGGEAGEIFGRMVPRSGLEPETN
jgi:hypothetical protein